ncbi:MAG TPA: mechanosensitive ion channel domain-containing protein [Pyrinomonadaceae bacterium]|nr:mechanosensitive ion channel domain-containing protein [Pyrinomonadaceae bacterium]
MLALIWNAAASFSVSMALSAQMLWVHLWLWQDQQAAQTSDTSLWGRIWHYIDYDFKFGKIVLSLSSLVQGLVVLLLAIIISRYLRSFIERRMAGRKHIDPGIQYTVLRLVHYFFITVGLLFALKTAFSLDLTSIAVVFTALSVGIGFGLQFIAGDLASGFILLFERPVRIGDFITVAGPDGKLTEGRVQSINLRTTVVVTNDHITAILPNSKLVNQELINWSYGERRSRISIPVGVAYDSDVALVTQTLLRAAEGVDLVLAEPKPSVQFLGFGESSLDFRLLVWTTRPRRHPQIKSDINYRIERLFRENRIEIPYPQRELRVRGGALQVERAGPESFEEEDHTEEPEHSVR